jgi:F0F1-type ATP synthase membrane subunit b/b'
VKRNLFLLAMVLVTAWSLWAVAQPTTIRPMPGGRGDPGGPRPMLAPGGNPTLPPAFRGLRPQPAATAKGPTVEGNDSEAEARAKAAEKRAEDEKEENAPPADINWVDFGRDTPPYVAMLINFGILIAGYYYLGKKPIAAALKTRRNNIAREIEEATKMRKEAEKRAKTYQAKLERLEAEMETTRETLVRAGEAERERLVQDAEAKAERMRKDAEFLVEQELKQLRVDLQRDTVEAAIAAAEELLKKRVTSADQERLAEGYLADLGRSSARGGQASHGGAS